jgi:transcriptional regulator with XRE-family HTH domain
MARRSAEDGSAATAGAVSTQLAELGLAMRRLRQRQGLTLVEVAGQTGFSHSLISQIERGVTRPSMETLHRVAMALGSSAQELLASSDDESVSVVRADEGISDVADGGRVRALVRGFRELQPLEFVGVAQEFGKYYDHPGAEILYIVEGTAEVDIAGQPPFVLGAGDTVYWAGGVRHRWRQVGDTPVRALLILANVGSAEGAPRS